MSARHILHQLVDELPAKGHLHRQAILQTLSALPKSALSSKGSLAQPWTLPL